MLPHRLVMSKLLCEVILRFTEHNVYALLQLCKFNFIVVCNIVYQFLFQVCFCFILKEPHFYSVCDYEDLSQVVCYYFTWLFFSKLQRFSEIVVPVLLDVFFCKYLLKFFYY